MSWPYFLENLLTSDLAANADLTLRTFHFLFSSFQKMLEQSRKVFAPSIIFIQEVHMNTVNQTGQVRRQLATEKFKFFTKKKKKNCNQVATGVEFPEF